MLARRFTIVCLFIAIFGMGLSILVAEKSRPHSRTLACDGVAVLRCGVPAGR